MDCSFIVASDTFPDCMSFLNIVKEQFQQDAQFQKALKEAFEEFINKEYYVSALLARYANDILKKGTKSVKRKCISPNHMQKLY